MQTREPSRRFKDRKARQERAWARLAGPVTTTYLPGRGPEKANPPRERAGGETPNKTT